MKIYISHNEATYRNSFLWVNGRKTIVWTTV